ncbi:hypothetical protein C1Y63_04505 [Corynebacterium sp. 13CS0277]|nr:hypothetical protein C1Y63_04505 [Corynebacterium sp. 13CS0277]
MAFSLEQLLADITADPVGHQVFVCVADEDQILQDVPPLGDSLPGSLPQGAEDPSVNLRILGWVEIRTPAGAEGTPRGLGYGADGDRLPPALMEITLSADIYPMPGDPVSTEVRDVVEELVAAATHHWGGAIESCTLTGAAEAPTRSVIGKMLYGLGFSLRSIDTIACMAMPHYDLPEAVPAGFSVMPTVSATAQRISVTVSGPAGEARCILERPEGAAAGPTATASIESRDASPSVIACALRVAMNQARRHFVGVRRIYSDDQAVALAMRAAGWQLGIVPVAGRAHWHRPAVLGSRIQITPAHATQPAPAERTHEHPLQQLARAAEASPHPAPAPHGQGAAVRAAR